MISHDTLPVPLNVGVISVIVLPHHGYSIVGTGGGNNHTIEKVVEPVSNDCDEIIL